MKVCVYGLGHLGSVTAACLAARRISVVGLDKDRASSVIEDTVDGEPGLSDLLRRGVRQGYLALTTAVQYALRDATILWVAFDTPVDRDNRADVQYIWDRLAEVREHVQPGTLVLISSQVPVGFTARLAAEWPDLTVAVSPENLRRGQAIQCFMSPGRVIIGGARDSRLEELFWPFCLALLWMSYESAEMVKHGINGFLATSISFANELGRISERVGADPKDVERGLRTDPRIGTLAYVAPGNPITGGTLLRDIEYLRKLAHNLDLDNPLIDAIPASNQVTAAVCV